MSANYTNIMRFIEEEIHRVSDVGALDFESERLKDLCSQLYMIEVHPELSGSAKKKEMRNKIEYFGSIVEAQE